MVDQDVGDTGYKAEMGLISFSVLSALFLNSTNCPPVATVTKAELNKNDLKNLYK